MMEMENQALQHVMNLQTQLMQQIINLQQKQQQSDSTPKVEFNPPELAPPAFSSPMPTDGSGAFGTPLPSNIASPTSPIPVDAQSFENVPAYNPDVVPAASFPSPKAATDPTKYGTYASPSFDGGRQNGASPSFAMPDQ